MSILNLNKYENKIVDLPFENTLIEHDPGEIKVRCPFFVVVPFI